MSASLHTSAATLDKPVLSRASVWTWRGNRWSFPNAYDVVRFVFASALLVAAALKMQALNSSVEAPAGWSKTARAFEVIIEWTVAVWIISGHAKGWARRASIVLLAAFLLFAGVHWFKGDQDCGCFGQIHLHPRWTFGFDGIALIALFALGKGHTAWSSDSHRNGAKIKRSALALAVGVVLPALTFVLSGHSARLIADSTRVVVLEPFAWKGLQFPLLNSIASATPDLARGRWIVVLADQNCHTCRDYVARTDLASLAEAGPIHQEPANVVLVYLATESFQENSFQVSIPVMRMKRDVIYVFEGPFLLFLSNGIVDDVSKPHESRIARK